MSKKIEALFVPKRGGSFKGRHSEAFLKLYDRDLRDIFRRSANQPLPSARTIAQYMTETHGEPVGPDLILKHLNLLKKGQPLWQ